MKKNINTRSFWNYQNSIKEKSLIQSQIYKHKHQIVLDWIEDDNFKLLNIGVGNGYLEKELLKARNKISLFGIDISDTSIKEAIKRYKGKFKIANIVRIPFKNNYFNYITVLDVLEHLSYNELNKALVEIRRVLKKNGVLILSVPLNENDFDKIANRHVLSFSKKSVLDIVIKHKFKVDKVEELYAFPNMYWIKSILSKITGLRMPNLLITKAVVQK